MRNVHLLMMLGLVVVVGAAIIFAGKFGQKSERFASGVIKLAPELVQRSRGINTLFIVVFDADSQMPMPYGATKIRLNGDPASEVSDFILNKERLMIMQNNRPFPQKMRLKARLDQDGVAGMDQPGDLVGVVAQVPLGSDDVEILIDQVVK